MTFSPDAKMVSIIPKFTSLLSMFGSAFIAIHATKQRNKTTHHRLLIGMSVCDFLVSTCFFLTTWPVPDFEDVYLASGTWGTCIAQGFFSQFSLAVAFYNASLSVYYMAVIRWGMTEDQIRIRLEPVLHATALILGLSTSVMGLPLNLYNNDNWECWISPYPLDCEESWNHGGKSTCIRGDNASLYRWLFYYMLLWIAIAVVAFNMYLVYRAVVDQEKLLLQDPADKRDQAQPTILGATEQHEQALGPSIESQTQSNSKKSSQRQYSKKVARQGYWYCGAFFLTWIFPTITRLVQVLNGSAPFRLILVTATFIPCQGIFNFLVYVMPRYESIIARSTKWTRKDTSDGFDSSVDCEEVTSY